MFELIVNSIVKTLLIVISSIIFTITINYLFYKDFKHLTRQIKRVISSHQANKITQIQKLLYNYFFAE